MRHSFLAYMGEGNENQKKAFKLFSKTNNEIGIFCSFCSHFLLQWVCIFKCSWAEEPESVQLQKEFSHGTLKAVASAAKSKWYYARVQCGGQSTSWTTLCFPF